MGWVLILRMYMYVGQASYHSKHVQQNKPSHDNIYIINYIPLLMCLWKETMVAQITFWNINEV